MSKTLNSVIFDLFSSEKDVVTFRDFSGDKKSLAYKRSAPKRTKDFPGMEKTELKLTLTDPVLGTIGIVTVSTSVRADTSDAAKTDLILSTAAAVDDASYSQLVLDQRLPLAG